MITEESTTPRRLPLGIQNFEELRRDNYLYVDKTDMLWQIANTDKYNYLSRPRRFGKSLLVSALQCYFEGKKELFEGLKIMQLEKTWTKRPVIHLSMNLGGSTRESLENYLNDTLLSYEAIYGKRESEQSLSGRFTGIIKRAYEKSGVQVAILVDEYDAPLQHTFDTGQHNSCREVYRDFFTGLKDYGYCLKCVFLTGITKFTQISLFSVLNTLSNISFRNEYATLCGMTGEEIGCTFSPEIERMAKRLGQTCQEIKNQMKDLYDGYHFSDNMVGVYNPFSVINSLREGKLKSYWTSTGANEMLPKILHNFSDDVVRMDNCLIDADYLETSDVSLADPKLFLYQAGYLTIKGVCDGSYLLGYPNREVKKALFGMVLPMILHKAQEELDNAVQRMKRAFVVGNVNEAMTCLQQLIAETPYSTQKKEHVVFEEHFRFIMKNLFYICGFDVREEVQMSGGRIDLIVKTPAIDYLFELKIVDNGGIEAASKQIESHRYAAVFGASRKRWMSLAVEFSRSTRCMEGWKVVNE